MNIRSLYVGLALAPLFGCAPAGAQSVPSPVGRVAAVAPTGDQEAPPMPSPQESTLEVSGTGMVSVPSDRARVTFAVETEGDNAAQASATNAAAMNAVLASLRSTGAEGLRIETHGYTLHPMYRNEMGDQQRIAGYLATNNVVASVNDVEAVGTLIDAAIGSGANRVAQLVFEASSTDEARLEALRSAVANARAEAEAIAGALGVELGEALDVRGGAQLPGPRPLMMARAEMAAVSTPVEAAEQIVTAHVTIRYALGARR